MRLILADSGGPISGTVVDASGSPVQGADVMARSILSQGVRLREDGIILGPSTPFEVTTSATGRFEFPDLAYAEYELVANAEGHPECSKSVQLSISSPLVDTELRLPAGGKLRGTAKFPDGSPATGAVIIAVSGVLSLVDSEIDESGTFVLEGLAPGTVEAFVGFGHTGDGQLTTTTLWLNEGGEVHWDAIVARPQDYSGRVVDATGEPLPGIWLRATSTDRRTKNAVLPQETAALAVWIADWYDRNLKWQLNQIATDAEGRFTLRGVPRPFAIEVRHPGGRNSWPARVFDSPPADGELVLSSSDRQAARLMGSIEGWDESSLASGLVYAVLRSGGERRIDLDEKGEFRFEGMPPGTYDVLVWVRGQAPQIVPDVLMTEGEQRELDPIELGR